MNKSKTELRAIELSKKFPGQRLFKNISFDLTNGNSICITGKNGSGKSTLLKIASGLMSPTSGRIELFHNSQKIDNFDFQEFIGFASPLLNPYPMLSALENLELIVKENRTGKIEEYLNEFELFNHRKKHVKEFSSGMIQRLRIITALLNDPEILILDEPGTNLDTRGKDIVYEHIENYRENRILLIATNEENEIDLCEREISIDE